MTLQKTAMALLSDLVRPWWRLVCVALLANITSALFEGSTIAALTLALQVLAGSSVTSLAQLFGPLGARLDGWIACSGREDVFLVLLVAAIFGQILRAGFQLLSQVAVVRLQANVQAEAHSRVYRRIMRLPFSKISAYRLGDLTSYLSQTDHFHEVIDRLNELARTLPLIGVYLLVLSWLSWPMTLIAVSAYWLTSRLYQKILTRVIRNAQMYTQHTVKLTERVTEFIQAAQLLHSYARQESTIRTVEELTGGRVAWRRRATLWSNFMEPVTEILTVLGAGCFLVGGYALLVAAQGTPTAFSHLLAFLMALYRVAPHLRFASISAAALAGLLPTVGRLAEILKQEEDPSDAANPVFQGLKEKIEFRNVSMRYLSSEPPVLVNLSFEVPRGNFIAMVGASGAGKSTVMDLLLRLFDPTEGGILADGVALRSYRKSSWRDRLGVVAQDTFLFHASIRENISFGRPEASAQEVLAAAQAAHADAFIQRLSGGYDTVVGDRGYRLSGGQCQRIALARALIRQPEILILDEATSALDSESERLIQRALECQRGRRTIFVIAHRLSTVAHADKILVLADGRLAEQGTHVQLLQRGGVYAHLWKLQSEERTEPDRETVILKEEMG